MPLKAVIFDLDLTLIASEAADQHRRKRDWQRVYRMVPDLTPYEGVTELIGWLREHGIRVAIVTSSPRPYCTRIVQHWGWHVDAMVCYHDTTRKKPHPDPILKVLDNLGTLPGDAIAIGDAPGDIVSAKSAGVFAIAALWGIGDHKAILAENPDHVCKTVADLVSYMEAQ
jgi:HAD superfamily hydrolase (TIGR01509 family)